MARQREMTIGGVLGVPLLPLLPKLSPLPELLKTFSLNRLRHSREGCLFPALVKASYWFSASLFALSIWTMAAG